MSQANVNVGTAPGAGNGDTLYNAFTKINTNFTELYSTITSSGVTYANISPSVDSSASGGGLTLNITKYANIYGVSVNLAGTSYALGETVRIWGNVLGGTYTTNDIVVSVSTLANSSIGSVGTVTFTGTPSRPVLTVAGRTGDVVLTTNDIVGLRSTFGSNADIQNAVDGKISSNIANLIGTAPGVLDTLGEIADALNDDANVYNTLVTTITTANTNMKGYTDNLVTTANVNMKGYVDAEITAIGAHYGNADVLAYLNDNNYATETYVDTANVNLKGYVDGEVTTLNSAITTANTNVVGYVDNAVSTANVNLKGYTDDQFTTGNTNVVGYVDGEVVTINSSITTANTNVVGYVDNAVSTANVNLKGYVDNELTNYATTTALTTANVNLKGYTDNELTNYATTTALTTANVNLKGYVDSEISDTVSATGSSIADANVNMKGYVDGQVTTLNSTITTANTNVVGYVDSAVSTANVNLKGYVDNELTSYATTSALTTANTNVVGYVDGQVTTLNSAITTANVNVVGYIDNEIAGLVDSAPGTLDTLNEIAAALGDDPNLATTLTNTISTANVNMQGYVDGQVTTLNSAITTANTNMQGYVDNAVSTANVNLKGYADATFLTSFTETNDLTAAVTWANIPDANVPSSAVTQHEANLTITESQISDLGTYATTTALTTANVNVVGYVDNAVTTANVNLKGYVDNEISGLSLGNIATVDLNGNVSTVLAGDGTFITAGSGGGGLADVVDDTTPQLGGNLDLNSNNITGTGNINITGTLTTSGTATFSGDAIFDTGVEEAFDTLTSSTGTVTHDCDNGHIFYHTTPSGNITANFTNLGLTAEYATTVTCIVNQGATAYIVNGVQIGGSAQTINWQGGVEPTGTDNGIDSFSFTILNDGGTYVVLGQMVDFT